MFLSLDTSPFVNAAGVILSRSGSSKIIRLQFPKTQLFRAIGEPSCGMGPCEKTVHSWGCSLYMCYRIQRFIFSCR